jgi:hypothetical protein
VEHGGKSEAALAAIAALRKDHLHSPRLAMLLERGYLVGRALGVDEGNAFLDEAAEQSGDDLVRAWCMYWRGQGYRRSKDDADKQRADELFHSAAKLAAGTPFADKIGAPVFEQEHLQIGQVAPDIAGNDVDGVAFKLSDYRGKVVVLDFWGFW